MDEADKAFTMDSLMGSPLIRIPHLEEEAPPLAAIMVVAVAAIPAVPVHRAVLGTEVEAVRI